MYSYHNGKILVHDITDNGDGTGTFASNKFSYYAIGYEDVVPTHEHSFCGWYTVKEPNCFNAGYEARVCSECNAADSRPLAATSHNYDVNGVCAICKLTKEAVATGTAPSRTNPNTGVHF